MDLWVWADTRLHKSREASTGGSSRAGGDRRGRRCAIIFLLLCGIWGWGSSPAVGDESYPWHTITLDTQAAGTFLITVDGDAYIGGGIGGGFYLRSSVLGGARFGVESGYSYQQIGASVTRSEIPIGFLGGYAFSPGGLLSLVPLGGVELVPQLTPNEPPKVNIVAGVQLELHLYNRNKIFMRPDFRITISRSPEPRFGISLGLKKSIPFMVPLQEMEPAFSLSSGRFSPDGDGYQDSLRIGISLEHPDSVAHWRLFIYDDQEELFYWRRGNGTPPKEILWNGTSNAGSAVEQAEEYSVELYLVDKVDRIEFFREIVLIDILLRKQGDRYLIQIPFITFPPNSADFSLLTDEASIERNREVIERLAEIFERFPEYRILIEGHANIEFYDDPERRTREQQEVLIPLSRKRAQAVKAALVDLGIARERLDTAGVGGARPIVPFSDEENRWKNRRVEFILIRKNGPDAGREAER